MTFLYRAAFYALVYAVMTDVGSLSDWLVGCALGFAVAVAASAVSHADKPRFSPLGLPTLLVGAIADIVSSAVRTLVFLLRRRESVGPGLVTCRQLTETPHGLAVLGLLLTASPGTAVTEEEAEARALTLHVLDPGQRPRICAHAARLYGRYQRKCVP